MLRTNSLWILATCLALVPLSGGSFGQISETAPTPTKTPLPTRTLIATSRDQLYRELASRVQEIQQHGYVLQQVAELARPSVVHIEADKRPPVPATEAFGQPAPYDGGSGEENIIEEAGSGTVIRVAARCFVLTNRHVLRYADLDGIRVRLANGRKLHATRKLADKDTDIALLELREQDCIAARLGDSDAVHVGEFVLAFGSPFGLNHSVTHGIISAKGRRDLILGDEDVRIQDFMQTDAAINPGNSGGPLFNLKGEVIGINTAIASNSGGNEGIGFSIPINMAMHVARQLIEHGQLVRGYLGVQLDADYDSDVARTIGLREYLGTRINKVTPGSPAAEAGIQPGDVVLRFDNATVEDDSHLVNLVGLEDAHAQVPLQIFRDGKEMSLTVALRPRTEHR